jgi:similar to stage IV sporulation protein
MNYIIIKIKRHDLNRCLLVLENQVKIIKLEKDMYYLKCVAKDLTLLKQSQLKYDTVETLGALKYMDYLKQNVSILAGIIIFTLILFLNTLSIKQISFNTYTNDNQEIANIINSHITNFYGYRFLNEDINEINLILRKEFSHYEWISVKKDGSLLDITILKPGIINKQVEKIDGFGDLIAKKDGLIKTFKVVHGVPLIEVNQSVKQGDILVSGNLRVKNPDQQPFDIPATGEVIAEVWYTKTIEVPKEWSKTEYTGKISTKKMISLFGLDIPYKRTEQTYEDFDTQSKESPLKIFNFELPFSIKETHYLEKRAIITSYNDESSFEYAYSAAVYDVLKELSQTDQVIKVETLKQTSLEGGWTYQFLVITNENIATFQRRALDE